MLTRLLTRLLRPSLAALALATPAVARAQDDPSELYLADMAATVKLPEGWTVPRWSDWDIDAVDRAETVQIHVGYTPYQATVDEPAAKAWAKMAEASLAEKHTAVEVVHAQVVENRGRRCADLELRYRYEGQQPAVWRQRSYAIDGKVVHLSATALQRNARRAEAALDTWDEALLPRDPAQDLGALPDRVQSPGGFETTVPTGWRVPLKTETSALGRFAAELGQALDPERCWSLMRAWPEGEADLILACPHSYYSGVVDTHSAAAVEEDLRRHFFKDLPIPPAQVLEVGADQRVGFFYTLPDRGTTAMRLAAVPYDQGYMLVWGFGRAAAAAELETAMRAATTTTTFTGPEGAEHPVGVIEVVDYYTTHRRGSPLVWGPPALLVAVVGSLVLGRKKRRPEDEDL